MSHAIPKAAFTAILRSGNGTAIGVPYSNDGNVHLTRDTGDALLLCDACEQYFNRNFDSPMINALKALENAILLKGIGASINFEADRLAHAIVSVAWRACVSPAFMYSEVNLSYQHLKELDALLRLSTSSILRNCTVRIGRLTDKTSRTSGGFSQDIMKQIVKTPETYRLKTRQKGTFDHFALDWTMFGFLFHLIVPRLPYPKSKNFGGLKRSTKQIKAVRADMFKYPPLLNALVAGYAAEQEGRISAALKNRDAKRSAHDLR